MKRDLIKQLMEMNEKFGHREHQLTGTEQLILSVDPPRGRVIPGGFALFDEVGAGKTKQVVDAAQLLFYKREIDTVLAIAPGFARSTWADPDPMLGEVSKHAWDNIPNVVFEFHGKDTEVEWVPGALNWIVTNFEYIRRPNRRDQLIKVLRGRRTWLVVDESWFIKSFSQQTRAVAMIRRKRCDRATILNGTPLSDGKPLDLFYQFAVLDPDIIGCKSRTHFKSKYCVVDANKRIVDYQNLDELNARVAPYVLSRRTRDCFDLPPMLDPITIEAPMTTDTWKVYREMRDDMVTWLDGQPSVSRQAVVKILRLAQITSGFLGGIEEDPDAVTLGGGASPVGPAPRHITSNPSPVPQWLRNITGVADEPSPSSSSQSGPRVGPSPAPLAFGGPFDVEASAVEDAMAGGAKASFITREIGREKLDAFKHWLDVYPQLPRKLLVWCRFRPEAVRLTDELTKYYKTVLNLWGGQTPDERSRVKRLLAPGGDPKPGAVVGITGTGAASLNFSAASIMVFMSHDPALIKRTQSIGRIERPGQTSPMLIVDVVATGPKGQKTIDHRILKALRAKDDMARWTVQQWRDLLKED